MMVFTDCFADVRDPRDFTAQHALTDILFVALVAMLCGARNCTEMALFGNNKLELLRQYTPLQQGVPSHDTFTRVFRLLDPQAFAAAFAKFMTAFGVEARSEARAGHGVMGYVAMRHVAVDGKSQRRAYDKGRAHMPPLVVTVFQCETFLSLSQAVAGSGGEAAAAIAALELVSLKHCLVTADALHCHKRFTKAVRDGGGDYAIPIKGNQSKLAKEAKATLDRAANRSNTVICETDETAHGRHEVRRCFVTAFKPPPGPNALVDLKYLARVEAWRTCNDKTTHRVRDYALSKRLSAQQMLEISRRHWDIENSLHWQLDVMMREDDSRTRKNNGPANLALMRRMALNVYRSDPNPIPLSHKRLIASWDQNDLLKAMTHMR